MPKEEWGVKRVCPKTGKRFYDLNANPVISPYTGEVMNLDTGKSSRTMVADKADKASAKDDIVDDTDAILETDDADDVDLDDDVLEDDDDDDVSLDDIADVAAPDTD